MDVNEALISLAELILRNANTLDLRSFDYDALTSIVSHFTEEIAKSEVEEGN